MKGTLHIVSTPIGNLEDITLRALRVLREVDIIAAEDTRHSRKLLNYYGIKKPMISFWGEKEKKKSVEILTWLHTGQSVAIISDAGTPGISDPGSFLIRKAIEENINVIPIPGPSALITALSVSGLPTEEFIFIGFLPTKRGQRQKILKDLSLEPRTLVFYEAPHRIKDTLTDMETDLGKRNAALIKELTKVHEEVLRGSISEILNKLETRTIAGEYIIIVEGRKKQARAISSEILFEISSLLKKGLSRKEAVKKIADAYGLSKKQLYEKSLTEL